MCILISSARQAQWRQDGSCIFPIGLSWKPVSPSCSSSGPLTWVNKVVPDSRTFLFLGHLCTSLELSVAWRHTCHLEKQVSACHLHASQLKVMLQPYFAFFPLNILAFINNITFSAISRISVSAWQQFKICRPSGNFVQLFQISSWYSSYYSFSAKSK